MTELKTMKNDTSVDDYIDKIENEEKRKDAQELVAIFTAATNELPKMWGTSIIGFGEYSYKRSDDKKLNWMSSGFSPRAQSLTLYIMSGFDEYAAQSGYNPKPLLNKLGSYKTGKSCLYIKKLQDVDESVLKDLIEQSHEHINKSHKSS